MKKILKKMYLVLALTFTLVFFSSCQFNMNFRELFSEGLKEETQTPETPETPEEPVDTTFAGGTGTQEDPYLISTVAQLPVRNEYETDHVSKHFY